MPTFFQDFISAKDPRIDENGILRVKATIARVGVQDYYTDDGKLERRLRPESEVMRSARTFSRAIITLNHPKGEFVNSENASIYLRGLSSECIYKDGFLDNELTITHSDAVIAACTTHKWLSCGYWADIEYASGVWIDELGVMGEVGKSYEYDSIQRNIRGNHIALVERARAGEKATIHDGMQFDNAPSIIERLSQKKSTMVQIIFNSEVLTLDGDDANKVKALIDKLSTDIKAIEQKLADAIAAKSEVEGKLLGETEKVKALENKATDADVNAEVQARLSAWSEVQGHVDAIDYSLTVPQIRKAYLLSSHSDLKASIEAGDDRFIDGMYEALKPKAASKTEDLKGVLDSAKPKIQTDIASSITERRMSALGGAK